MCDKSDGIVEVRYITFQNNTNLIPFLLYKTLSNNMAKKRIPQVAKRFENRDGIVD